MSVKNTIFSFPESIPKMPQQKRTKNVKHAKKVIDGFPLILIFSWTFSEISLKRMWLYVFSDMSYVFCQKAGKKQICTCPECNDVLH